MAVCEEQILQAVFRPCLNPAKVDVMILDIKEDWTCSAPYIFGDSNSIDLWFGPDPPEPRGKKLGYSALREFLKLPKPADVFVRLFLVEDLSPAVIEALGFTLNLDPDFFAEQIVDTDYTLEGHKDLVEIRDALPSMPFLLKPKTFFSSTWKRSALHNGWEGNGPLDKSHTASHSDSIEEPKTSAYEARHPHAKKYRQYNNMHRPFDTIGEHVMSRESKTAVAMEERVTFLRKDDDYGWTGELNFSWNNANYALQGMDSYICVARGVSLRPLKGGAWYQSQCPKQFQLSKHTANSVLPRF